MQVPTPSTARPESGSEAAHDQPIEAWKTTWVWAKNRAPQAALQCCLLRDDGPGLAHNENTRWRIPEEGPRMGKRVRVQGGVWWRRLQRVWLLSSVPGLDWHRRASLGHRAKEVIKLTYADQSGNWTEGPAWGSQSVAPWTSSVDLTPWNLLEMQTPVPPPPHPTSRPTESAALGVEPSNLFS